MKTFKECTRKAYAVEAYHGLGICVKNRVLFSFLLPPSDGDINKMKRGKIYKEKLKRFFSSPKRKARMKRLT